MNFTIKNNKISLLIASLLGGLGTVLRYYLSFLSINIITINLIAVFLIGFTSDYHANKRRFFHTGFLGGFSSLATIYVIAQYSIFLIIIQFILYTGLYFIVKKLKLYYDYFNH